MMKKTLVLGDMILKNKIIGMFCMVLGLSWLLGCIYNIITNILIAIELNDMPFAFGSVLGASVVGVLGFFVFKYGFKKYKNIVVGWYENE